jgi:hypothetical protein
MAKPIRIEWTASYGTMRKALNTLEADYEERFSPGGRYSFNSTVWTVQLFKGKGSRRKNQLLRMLAGYQSDYRPALKEIFGEE